MTSRSRTTSRTPSTSASRALAPSTRKIRPPTVVSRTWAPVQSAHPSTRRDLRTQYGQLEAAMRPDPGPTEDGAATNRRRVVVADDDVLLREGITSLLKRSGFDVVGQAGDG